MELDERKGKIPKKEFNLILQNILNIKGSL